MLNKIKSSFKYIKLYDIASVFIFIFMLPVALVCRAVNKVLKREIWLVCEDGYNARDNGFYFYKYMKTEHKDVLCYYVIDKKSKAYDRVKEYGNIIQFKSLKHWLYYMTAKYNISNQKHGNPNQPLFYVVHVILGWFNNRIFLQHGVIKDMCDWLLYKNTKFRCFICGAKREYEYVRDNYGYPEGYVNYTGLARFDGLHNFEVNEKQILVMPSWRSWLGRDVNKLSKTSDFKETDFYKYWMSLLNDEKFIDFIEKNGMEVVFYPHINMQKYLDLFEFKSDRVKKASTETDIQQMLKSSSVMITDYSSVYMDYAYMRKPVIYYQFDQKEYRAKQYQEGYFSYENDGFGPVFVGKDDVTKYLKKIYKDTFKPEDMYLTRMKEFFELYDTNNCFRTYDLLKNNLK